MFIGVWFLFLARHIGTNTIKQTEKTMCSFSSTSCLFDFTNSTSTVNDWIEISDTQRDVGKSKGILTEQKTQTFQRAIFF